MPLSCRQAFQQALREPACLSPASVYDPLSARLAESLGYRMAVLGGSVASYSTLAAPDVMVMTLTEVADQVRRIVRASTLALLVDADHGYGNALNVYRTIEELEHAGAAAVSIEDTLLPQPFGAAKAGEALVSIEEMAGKLRAAVAARRDPDFAIAGRTSALHVEGLEGAVSRARAFAGTGIDALFVIGLQTEMEVRALHEASRLPIIAGPSLKVDSHQRPAMAAAGVAILLQGHQPIAAAAKALCDAYQHLLADGDPKALDVLDKHKMDDLLRTQEFNAMLENFLR